jgi:hypothetical protein
MENQVLHLLEEPSYNQCSTDRGDELLPPCHPLLFTAIPYQQPLRYDRSRTDEKKCKVRFQENVSVIEIPSFRDYDSATRNMVWGGGIHDSSDPLVDEDVEDSESAEVDWRSSPELIPHVYYQSVQQEEMKRQKKVEDFIRISRMRLTL